jgi:hypothetical protein
MSAPSRSSYQQRAIGTDRCHHRNACFEFGRDARVLGGFGHRRFGLVSFGFVDFRFFGFSLALWVQTMV